MEGFSRKEVQRAALARIAQSKVAHPPDSKFKQMVSSPSFKNCPVTVNDVTNARAIFGPDLAGLAGRSTRRKPKRVVPEYMGIPRELYERHKYVTLTADVMFVNGIAFLVSLSRGIRMYTCEHVPNRKAKQLSRSLRRIINLYARGGFKVRTIMMDVEFEKVKDQEGMELVDVNTTAAREHVGAIERGI